MTDTPKSAGTIALEAMRPGMPAAFGGYEATYRGKDITKDYRHAQVLTLDGRLGEIVAVTWQHQSRGMRGYIATLRHFNGEPMDDCPLSMLHILERD